MTKKDADGKGKAFAALTVLGMTGYYGLTWLGRTAFKGLTNSFIHRLMVDPYHENLWEPVSAFKKVGLQNVLETNLRSQQGKVIKRPLGSPKKFPDLENVMFNTAQLHSLPVNKWQPIDTSVTIGPKAAKPLAIQMPIMISAMAYGVALSSKVKIALAQGSSVAGTATNSGEGAFLPEERQAAHKMIIQYVRGTWNKSETIFRQADAIEIQLGQGASGGGGSIIPSKEISCKVKKAMGVKWGSQAFVDATIPGMKHTNHLPRLVALLRDVSEGVPVGVKMSPGKYLEQDMEIALDAGVDFIVLDGAEAGSKGTPPILQDDFALPTLFALARAGKFMEQHKCRNRVSLVVSGGLYNPGQMLKALALGADAVYIGSVALFGVSHTETLKALPFEPPTAVTYDTGAFSKKFNINKGAKNISNFLIACDEEIKEGIRALGKTSLKQVDKSDLFALDDITAKILDIPVGYKKIIAPDSH